VQLCPSIVRDELGAAADLRAKQLFHDREEITVFAAAARRSSERRAAT
jgi:23S rRNA C2498 (ribose-2'-O)-methylase RlmM